MENFHDSSLARFETIEDLLSFIKEDANSQGNLSIRGVARLAGVSHNSIIESGHFKSQKIAVTLTGQGFDAGDLALNGFPPKAVILTLEYFAYESKAKAPQAKAIMRTFGVVGLMATLDQLRSDYQPKPPKTYLEALKALVASEEAKQRLELENQELTKENELLSEAVDELFNYSSIIRVAKFNQVSEKLFNWRSLKAQSTLMGLEVKKVPCPRFGTKNLYSHEVWRVLYPQFKLPETLTIQVS